MKRIAILFCLLPWSNISFAQQVKDTVLVHSFVKSELDSGNPQAMVFWFSSAAEAKIIMMGEMLFTKKPCVIKGKDISITKQQHFENIYISKNDFDKFNEFFIKIIYERYLIVEKNLPKITCSVFNYPDRFVRKGDWGGYKSFQFYNDSTFVYYEFNRTSSYLDFLNKCLVNLQTVGANNESTALMVAVVEKQIIALKAEGNN